MITDTEVSPLGIEETSSKTSLQLSSLSLPEPTLWNESRQSWHCCGRRVQGCKALGNSNFEENEIYVKSIFFLLTKLYLKFKAWTILCNPKTPFCFHWTSGPFKLLSSRMKEPMLEKEKYPGLLAQFSHSDNLTPRQILETLAMQSGVQGAIASVSPSSQRDMQNFKPYSKSHWFIINILSRSPQSLHAPKS